MYSFLMSAAKHFYDNPLSIYLDPKIVLIYRPHPVNESAELTQGALKSFITLSCEPILDWPVTYEVRKILDPSTFFIIPVTLRRLRTLSGLWWRPRRGYFPLASDSGTTADDPLSAG
jgi:hypothetical protein